MFKGAYTALITPFKNGKVDEKKLRELVDWQISEKVDGLVPVGTTGESPTLSYEEHIRVIEVVVEAARRRVPVMAGAGSNSTEEAIHLTTEAKRVGADAILSVVPYYNRPTQEGLKSHFGAVAEAVDIPIVLYNIPSRSGVGLNPDTIAQIAAKHKNIVGVKESTGSMDQSTEIIQRTGKNFCLLSGDDSLTLPLMALGASGVISVAANLIPGAISDLCSFIHKGDLDRARDLHVRLYPLIKSLFLESNPSPVKAAMLEAGLIDDEAPRLPLVKVTDDTRFKIKAAMKAFSVKISTGAR